MKRVYLLLVFSLGLLSSSYASERVEINSDLDAFNKIVLEGVFNVVLEQGDKEGIFISAKDKDLEQVSYTSENGVLKVETDEKRKNSNLNIDITIYYIDLKRLEVNSVGALKTNNAIKAKQFDLDISSVGLNDLEFDVRNLNCSVSTVGKVVFKGKAIKTKIDMSGIGKLEAKDLISEEMVFNNSGIGAASIYASKKLEVNSSGIGRVAYYGNPEKKEINASGLGSVVQK